jgi:drug/metabolite transporter (DMT)-like permease
MTTKGVWIAALLIVAGVLAFEVPWMATGLWHYYGRQSLQPFGWMPLWYAFASAMLTFVPAVAIARVQDKLHGARSLLLVPLVIMTSIGAVAAVSWPMYLAMSSTWSDASIHLAALTSIALVGVAVWFCAPLVAQPERTLDRSTPVTAPR